MNVNNLRCADKVAVDRPLALLWFRRNFLRQRHSQNFTSTSPQLTYHFVTCLRKVIFRHIFIHRILAHEFFISYWLFPHRKSEKPPPTTETGKCFFTPAALGIKRISYRWRIHQIFNNRKFSFFLWRRFFYLSFDGKRRFWWKNGRKAEWQDEFFSSFVN